MGLPVATPRVVASRSVDTLSGAGGPFQLLGGRHREALLSPDGWWIKMRGQGPASGPHLLPRIQSPGLRSAWVPSCARPGSQKNFTTAGIVLQWWFVLMRRLPKLIDPAAGSGGWAGWGLRGGIE